MVYAPHETVSDAIKRAGLPQTHRIHWSEARKEDVVRAVHDRLISFDEARWRYLLSRTEFRQWEKQVDARHGDQPDKRQPLKVQLTDCHPGELEDA